MTEYKRYWYILKEVKTMNEYVDGTLKVAEGVSNLGAMVVVTAVFIVLAAVLMVSQYVWTRSIINRILNQHEANMKTLVEGQRSQNEMLCDLSEGLRVETKVRIRAIVNVYFDLAVERICRLIKQVREENNIANRDATESKVRIRVLNLYKDHKVDLESFTYRGKKLSEFLKEEWTDQVIQEVLKELYHKEGPNNRRAYFAILALYTNFKQEIMSSL